MLPKSLIHILVVHYDTWMNSLIASMISVFQCSSPEQQLLIDHASSLWGCSNDSTSYCQTGLQKSLHHPYRDLFNSFWVICFKFVNMHDSVHVYIWLAHDGFNETVKAHCFLNMVWICGCWYTKLVNKTNILPQHPSDIDHLKIDLIKFGDAWN